MACLLCSDSLFTIIIIVSVVARLNRELVLWEDIIFIDDIVTCDLGS